MAVREKQWFDASCIKSPETHAHHFVRLGESVQWVCKYCDTIKFYPVSTAQGEAYNNMLVKLGYSITQMILTGHGWSQALSAFKSSNSRNIILEGDLK